MKRLCALLMTALMCGPAQSHPHIFVDTGLDLHFDAQGRLSEVRITWAYDEFYSLLITEDRGLDADFDGEMTPAEIEDLTGFDMQWTPGFNGDLVILQDGRELSLSAPLEATATYTAGRITTTHLRRVAHAPVSGAELEIKPYDPTYYTAYDVTLPVRLMGGDACRQRIDMPDLDARLMEVRDQLNALDMMTTPEEQGLPDIGVLLATTVRVTCDIS